MSLVELLDFMFYKDFSKQSFIFPTIHTFLCIMQQGKKKKKDQRKAILLLAEMLNSYMRGKFRCIPAM